MTNIDCSLQVFEVKLGGNVIGILQSLTAEHDMQTFTDMRGGQHRFLTQGTTLTLKMLMTREQKSLYAVMNRLVKDLKLYVDMHNQGTFLIEGTQTLSRETLQEFADKKHAANEVEFVFENASLSVMKERKHVKTSVH